MSQAYLKKEVIGGAELWLGDAELLAPIFESDVTITDPVWPNCPEGLIEGAARVYEKSIEMHHDVCMHDGADCCEIRIVVV